LEPDCSNTEEVTRPYIRNRYGVILVNQVRYPSAKKDLGQQFIDWLISTECQNAIARYKISGQQLFHPDANDPDG
jgi:tungstate transport system substrate-binding protein